ncbi:hypothetical protein S40285_10221 [Stachybotrys chlorohalonatus IBT 40285]|uniref:Secreted protein n=1 Tax=Stachybotrys chlorohalonatus (strain IBT 40285) TaxID=1283841 RepID=A0A084QV23_STAC4|nr:hypothetical protein S40285_10221 [Stachybotrys chlorohalonata IBT 40285]
MSSLLLPSRVTRLALAFCGACPVCLPSPARLADFAGPTAPVPPPRIGPSNDCRCGDGCRRRELRWKPPLASQQMLCTMCQHMKVDHPLSRFCLVDCLKSPSAVLAGSCCRGLLSGSFKDNCCPTCRTRPSISSSNLVRYACLLPSLEIGLALSGRCRPVAFCQIFRWIPVPPRTPSGLCEQGKQPQLISVRLLCSGPLGSMRSP